MQWYSVELDYECCPTGLLSSVVYASDVQKVWLDLKERFDTVNGSRIFQLHRGLIQYSRIFQLRREIHTLV